VAVGKEHGRDVGEVPPDPAQKPPQTPAREPGVDEQPPPASLQVSRVARAAARKYAKTQGCLQISVLIVASSPPTLAIKDLSMPPR
jgi:hypothetical protein